MKVLIVNEFVEYLEQQKVNDPIVVSNTVISNLSIILRTSKPINGNIINDFPYIKCYKEMDSSHIKHNDHQKKQHWFYQVQLIMIKEVKEPWFSWIAVGVKTHEGRLLKGDWKDLTIGDRILLYNEYHDRQLIKVIDLITFDTFDQAYKELGTSLIPTLPENTTAEQCYQEIHTGLKIKDFTKVIIEMELLSI